MSLRNSLESKFNLSFSKGNLKWPGREDLHFIRTKVRQEQMGLLDKAHLYGFFSPKFYERQEVLVNSLFFKILAIHELRIPNRLRPYAREKNLENDLRLNLLNHVSLKLQKTEKDLQCEQNFLILVNLVTQNLVNLILEPLVVEDWSPRSQSSKFKEYKRQTFYEIKKRLAQQTDLSSSRVHNNILELYLTKGPDFKVTILWILKNLPLHPTLLLFVGDWLTNGLLDKTLSLTSSEPTFQIDRFSQTLSVFLLRDLQTTITGSMKSLEFKQKLNSAYNESGSFALRRAHVSCIHHGNHVIFVAHSSYVIEHFIKLTLVQFLSVRGLLSSLRNIRSYKAGMRNERLNFLGYTFSTVLNPGFSQETLVKTHSNSNKTIAYPQSGKRVELLRELKIIFKRSQNLEAYDLIRKLNPILRRWLLYYNEVNSTPFRVKIKNSIHYLVWNWALKKHKGWKKELIARTYFKVTTKCSQNFKKPNNTFFGIKGLKRVYLIDPTKLITNNYSKEDV